MEGHVVGLPALHIMGHPYIFPAYRGCHLFVEETDRRTGAVLVHEGHRLIHAHFGAHTSFTTSGMLQTDVSSTGMSQAHPRTMGHYRGLLLLGCNRQMCQVQEGHRLHPYKAPTRGLPIVRYYRHSALVYFGMGRLGTYQRSNKGSYCE